MLVCAHVYADMLFHTCVSQRQILSRFFHFSLRLFTWWFSYFLIAVINHHDQGNSLTALQGVRVHNGQGLKAPHPKLQAGSQLLSSQGPHTGTSLPHAAWPRWLWNPGGRMHNPTLFPSFMPLKPVPHGCCCQVWLPAWDGPLPVLIILAATFICGAAP